MTDAPDPVALAVLHLALAADPARSARLEVGLLALSRSLGASLEDRASAIAYAVGNTALQSSDPGTLLAAMFALARVSTGMEVACSCGGFCRCSGCIILRPAGVRRLPPHDA